jgi:hypothetical protein
VSWFVEWWSSRSGRQQSWPAFMLYSTLELVLLPGQRIALIQWDWRVFLVATIWSGGIVLVNPQMELFVSPNSGADASSR